MSNLFIKWLKEFTYLKDAGYVAVFLVSLKLVNTALIEAHTTKFEFPEIGFMAIILLVFVWGFSKKKKLISQYMNQN
jgi:predicted tellurium resistance membrane protein TerC